MDRRRIQPQPYSAATPTSVEVTVFGNQQKGTQQIRTRAETSGHCRPDRGLSPPPTAAPSCSRWGNPNKFAGKGANENNSQPPGRMDAQWLAPAGAGR
ncbi:MAG: hypothetical protein ACON4W_05830 [Parvibaculales bacterium]